MGNENQTIDQLFEQEIAKAVGETKLEKFQNHISVPEDVIQNRERWLKDE